MARSRRKSYPRWAGYKADQDDHISQVVGEAGEGSEGDVGEGDVGDVTIEGSRTPLAGVTVRDGEAADATGEVRPGGAEGVGDASSPATDPLQQDGEKAGLSCMRHMLLAYLLSSAGVLDTRGVNKIYLVIGYAAVTIYLLRHANTFMETYAWAAVILVVSFCLGDGKDEDLVVALYSRDSVGTAVHTATLYILAASASLGPGSEPLIRPFGKLCTRNALLLLLLLYAANMGMLAWLVRAGQQSVWTISVVATVASPSAFLSKWAYYTAAYIVAEFGDAQGTQRLPRLEWRRLLTPRSRWSRLWHWRPSTHTRRRAAQVLVGHKSDFDWSDYVALAIAAGVGLAGSRWL